MSLARRNFEAIWKQDRRYLGGKGQSAPNLQFVPKGHGYTTTGTVDRADSIATPGMPRSIRLGPNARRALKHYDPKSGKDPSGIRFAIEHELGRYFGPDQPLTSPDGNAGAGGANAVANRLTRARNQKGKNPRPYFRKHLPYLDQDPGSILWPSS